MDKFPAFCRFDLIIMAQLPASGEAAGTDTGTNTDTDVQLAVLLLLVLLFLRNIGGLGCCFARIRLRGAGADEIIGVNDSEVGVMEVGVGVNDPVEVVEDGVETFELEPQLLLQLLLNIIELRDIHLIDCVSWVIL